MIELIVVPAGSKQIRILADITEFQEDILEVVDDEQKTFIFVTHSIEEAVYVSQSIALLLPRPSRVSEIIRPDIRRDISPDAIRRDTVYLDIVERIWQGLRTYVE